MPNHVVDRVPALLTEVRGRPEGARALLLGITYKADVADVRQMPAHPVAAGLLAAGAEVSYHDPYIAEFTVGGRSLPRAENLQEAMAEADVAILLQDHACYAREALGQARCALLDTRGKAVGSRVTLL